ncbi:hypothetical protein C1H46_023158 [Malus baccata]|uniref:Leucine-rich repeat-containing N-terminal plant-type domain-containing protein n=1 Tax=Malus baccata TaxID=106549 RepID=A0A540LY87_MALBA|nr:hypothetical protein C1H46_023158 [Malus baccata]
MRIGDNGLTGSIPATFGNLVNLITLGLASCSLNDPIPPQLGRLGLLENLILQLNQLENLIPAELGNFSSLTIFTAAKNTLNRTIPQRSAISLATLVLSNNSHSGVVPRNLCSNTRSLELLMISGSGLVGEIPAELSQCRSMKQLDLSNNLINGSIPDEIYGLVELTDLLLHNNSLVGSISSLDGIVPLVASWSPTHTGDTGNGAKDCLCSFVSI